MKRKLTFREQWEIAYRNHRIAEGVDTEGMYAADDCPNPVFRQAIIRSAAEDKMLGRYDGKPIEGKYLDAFACAKRIREKGGVVAYKDGGTFFYVFEKPKAYPPKPPAFSLWPAPPVGVQK